MLPNLLVWTTFTSVFGGLFAQSTSYGSSYGNGMGGSVYGAGNYGGSSSATNTQCAQQCPFDYRPVCGSNGKTYSNSCQLRCEQAFTLTLVLQNEGACIGSGSVNSYGSSSGQPGFGFNFGTSFGNSNNMGMQGISSPSCQWQCQSDFSSNSYGSTSGQPYGGTYSSTYGSSVYGQSPQMAAQVCDNRGLNYPSECAFHRAMCDGEKRGIYLTKLVCPYGGGGYSSFNNFGNNNYRRGLLLDQAATTEKPAAG